MLRRWGPPPADVREGDADERLPALRRPPQLSYLAESGEALVSGPRQLLCCRCGESWISQRMTWRRCGEQSTSKPPIFADAERFPHLRATPATPAGAT